MKSEDSTSKAPVDSAWMSCFIRYVEGTSSRMEYAVVWL